MINERVSNGYGINTSKLSISMIGEHNIEAPARQARQRAQEVSVRHDFIADNTQQKKTHPIRRELHSQSHYPVTVNRLQHGQVARLKTPPDLKQISFPPGPDVMARMPTVAKDGKIWNPPELRAPLDARVEVINPGMRGRVSAEFVWNNKRLNQNVESGRIARVDKIITGASERPKGGGPLFPVGGTHQQLLGLDNKLVGANAQQPPPSYKAPVRWLGPAIGWSDQT